ncbi:hypothetical protein Asulf_01500 [Archaeoglobus sulfaticallidus PM70-1]|uniref:Uncharacterized protein n=1 Tax=Archaeoglobus sulfaticallidus PM70-1 TaxID=387631 RepID=N0BEQ5_9EURY|nr:hypothetical protein [Archaeoglobus sulfaticallidus]AGK61483.1 hypothetical protein Asulf_01500 [Archaeoglobus sulfaticallidus PM70-1]
MTYLTLKSLSAEDSLKGRKIKAKLEGNGTAKITITIKAEKKEDIKEILKTLKKGAVFELQLKPIGSLHDRTLDDFQIFGEGG